MSKTSPTTFDGGEGTIATGGQCMQYRMTSRRRKPRGNSTPPQQRDKQADSPRTLRVPDESVDSQQADEPSAQRVEKLAAEDIERGVVDTDRGPAMDETYERARGSDDTPDRKFNP